MLPADLLLNLERYADGELSPAETATFESRLAGNPELAARVGAELAAREQLRAAVARAMEPMPAGGATLRGRVEAALDAALDAGLDHARGSSAGERFERLTPRSASGTLHWRWVFTSPRRANVFAVAASLLLVAGAVLFGINGPRVSDRPKEVVMDTPVTEVADIVSTEHESCAARGTCTAQFQPWRSLDEAQRSLSSLLGRRLVVPDLEQVGYTFCCGGQCLFPGAGDRAGHLLYCRLDETGENCTWLSIFAAPVETPYVAFDPFGRAGPLQCGIEYSLGTPAGGEMHYWCDGVVTWFVKSSDPSDFELVRKLFPDA